MAKKKKVKPPVGRFKNKNGLEILIYAKKGESAQNAIKRVTARHGVSPNAVKK